MQLSAYTCVGTEMALAPEAALWVQQVLSPAHDLACRSHRTVWRGLARSCEGSASWLRPRDGKNGPFLPWSISAMKVSVWPAASKTFTARCGTAGGMHARAHARENTHAHMHACFTDRQTDRQMQRVTQRRAHTQTGRMRACIAGMSACTCLCTYANIGISTHRIHRDHTFCQHGVIRVLKVPESPYKVPKRDLIWQQ